MDNSLLGGKMNVKKIGIDDEKETIKFFEEKMNMLSFLRETLMFEGAFNEKEKNEFKNKIIEIVNSIDFEPTLYKKKLITEKTN